MTPPPLPSDEALHAAVTAACEEAGWDWHSSLVEHIPSAYECMRPIVEAALEAWSNYRTPIGRGCSDD